MTNTPSEGTSTTNTQVLSPQEQLIAERVTRLVEIQLAAQQRSEQLRQRSLGARTRRIAPWAAVGAVGAATEPGQQVLGAAGDAGQAIGRGAVDAGQAIGEGAVDAGQAVGEAATDAYNATVDQVQETAGDIAQGATDAYNATVDQVQETAGDIAQGANSAWDATVQGLGTAAQWTGDRISDMSSAVSGWAVETWGTATDIAHSVGAWGAQYADQIAANPGNAAVTASLGAAAVVAASPQLRENIGNAVRAASRWSKEAVSAVVQKGRELAVGAALAYNNLRGMTDGPRGANPKETHAIVSTANEITGGDRQLPSVAEVKQSLTPGHDPAMAPAGSKLPEAAAQTGQTAQGAGAAERTGASVDPKTRGGQSQGL